MIAKSFLVAQAPVEAGRSGRLRHPLQEAAHLRQQAGDIAGVCFCQGAQVGATFVQIAPGVGVDGRHVNHGERRQADDDQQHQQRSYRRKLARRSLGRRRTWKCGGALRALASPGVLEIGHGRMIVGIAPRPDAAPASTDAAGFGQWAGSRRP